MKKYKCTICGFIYDDAKERVKFEDLPETWVCPLCGAPKSAFEEIETQEEIKNDNLKREVETLKNEVIDEDMRKLSAGELSAICSNLSKACEKQYLDKEKELFEDLADYYQNKVVIPEKVTLEDLSNLINEDLKSYPIIMNEARDNGDRGTLRALTWSEKVTRILASIIKRYDKDGVDIIKNTNVFVCDICGFVYIGDKVPDVCPVCKVPSLKIVKMGGLINESI